MLGKHFGVQESVMLTFRHQLEQNSGELIETLQQCIESNAETTKTSLDVSRLIPGSIHVCVTKVDLTVINILAAGQLDKVRSVFWT